MATVHGTNNSEVINGVDGVTNDDDTIYGYAGNDMITGLGGDDLIIGGAGADFINGATGIDTASYVDSPERVGINLDSGVGTLGTAEGDQLSGIENVTGSYYGDVLLGNATSNLLAGMDGNDTLKGGGGADILYGGYGEDTLNGGAGADILNGGDGFDIASYFDSPAAVFISLQDDIANGGDATGDDLNSIQNVTGSGHDDNLWGNGGNNELRGESGNDSLKGFGGSDKLYGGGGNDSLYGMDWADTLVGQSGNDILDGGANNDIMAGGTGDDIYYVDAADIITEFGSEGNDTVFSSANSHTLAYYIETLSLDTDTDSGVYGTGNPQPNTIFGNVNDNILEGGGSADQLNGLGGNDNFVFRPGDANGDTIYEFEGNGAGVGDFMYFIGYGTQADGASFVQLTATTWQINSADGLTHDTITFSGGAAIDPGDFVFV